jgi:hypothetical protein
MVIVSPRSTASSRSEKCRDASVAVMVFMRPFYLIIRFTTRPMTHGGVHRQVPRRWSFGTAPYVRGAPCNRDWLMKPSFADCPGLVDGVGARSRMPGHAAIAVQLCSSFWQEVRSPNPARLDGVAVREAPGTDCPVLSGTLASRVNPSAGETCRRQYVRSSADGPSGPVAQCPGGRSWHGAWSFFPGPVVKPGGAFRCRSGSRSRW